MHRWKSLSKLGASCVQRLRQKSHTLPTITSTYRCFSDEPIGTDQVEVLIIGGGVIGTSIAYHLAKNGQKDVLLLEKSELTAGSTWHAAGLTAYFHPGINMRRVHYDSLQLFSTLFEETGQEVGFHRCGSIRLATTPTRVDEFKYNMSRHGWLQAPQRLISPEEVRELHPLVNTDKVLMGLYNKDDGYIDPYSLTQALAIGARNHGAKFLLNSPVSSMNQTSDGGWQVNTSKGQIKAKKVVNAGGFWARDIGQLAGLDLPVVAAHHTYVVTSELPEVAALSQEPPVIRDLEASCYVRLERKGLLVGPYESEEKVAICKDWYDNGVTPGFGKELFEGDLDKLNDYLEMIMETLPIFREASIKNVICGPITYAPENIPIVGPYPGLANYWTAIGFGYGIIHSGGVGKYMADWMMKGEPAYDLIETDPCKYGWWTDRTYLMAKVSESYGLNNAIIFPKEERPAGRPTKRNNPLYSILQDQGAVFGFKTGWEQPNWFALMEDDPRYSPSFYRTNWFEPVGREVAMVREGVGLIDLTAAGKFKVTGKDARAFLDYFYSNIIPQYNKASIAMVKIIVEEYKLLQSKLARPLTQRPVIAYKKNKSLKDILPNEFKSCYTLTPSGKVYAENLVVCEDENQYFCVTGHLSELHDFRYMQDIAREMNFAVEISNVSDSFGCLGLAGPRSHDVLSSLTSFSLSNKSFIFDLADSQVLAVQVSLTGEPGWELYTDNNNLINLYKALKHAGKQFQLGNFGAYAYTALRIEGGIPVWGSESKLDYNVLESRLENRIDADKPSEFIGKSAIQKLKQAPLEQELVLLSMTTDNVDPDGNETIWKGDKVIGHTTSGCYGYTVRKSLAFAFLPPEESSPGSEVQVELMGQRYSAKVLAGSPLENEGNS